MIKTSVVTSATGEPITTAEIRSHLRISSTLEDTYLDSLEIVARQRAESITGRKLMPQTHKVYFDMWPDGYCFEMPYTPMQSVPTTGIVYKDSTGNSTTFGSTKWDTDIVSEPGRVCLRNGSDWDGDTLYDINPISIEFKCGYSTGGSTSLGADERGAVQEAIKQAMKLMIGHWYEQREDTNVRYEVYTIPLASEQLLAQYKVFNFTS